MLHDVALFRFVAEAVEDGEHVGELGDLGVQQPVLQGVEVGAVFLAPEGGLYFGAEGGGQGGVVEGGGCGKTATHSGGGRGRGR